MNRTQRYEEQEILDAIARERHPDTHPVREIGVVAVEGSDDE